MHGGALDDAGSGIYIYIYSIVTIAHLVFKCIAAFSARPRASVCSAHSFGSGGGHDFAFLSFLRLGAWSLHFRLGSHHHIHKSCIAGSARALWMPATHWYIYVNLERARAKRSLDDDFGRRAYIRVCGRWGNMCTAPSLVYDNL